MKTRKCRAGSGGFTLLELLVVIVIIGMLATLALKAYAKSIGKGSMATAVSGLASIATTLEGQCLTQGAINVTSTGTPLDKIAQSPKDYTWSGPTGTSCASPIVTAVGANGLPNLCIGRKSSGLWFYGFTANSDYKFADIPLNEKQAPQSGSDKVTCASSGFSIP